MEHLRNPRVISRDQRCMSSPESVSAPRNRQGKKLRDILLSDRPNLSYADFHHEITRNPDDALPKYLGTQQNQVLDRRNCKEDELVRYMSNLPSYLEKGTNFQEKGLNVGVLDWRRLEKWRHSQNQQLTKQTGCSPSSSTTSLFSTDGSSTYSSRGLSCSPSRQRLHRLSQQSPLEASSKEALVQDPKSSSGRGHNCSPAHQKTHTPLHQPSPQKVCAAERTSVDLEVFGRNAKKFQDSTVSNGNILSKQQRVLGLVQPCERQDSDLKPASEMGAARQTFDKHEVAAHWKGKSKIHSTESARGTSRLQETKSVANQDCSGKEKPGIVKMPREISEHRCSSTAAMENFVADGRLSVDPCQKSFLVRNNREPQLFSKDDHRQHLQPSESCSQRPYGVKSSSQQSNTLFHSANIGHCSSRSSAQGSKGAGAPQSSHLSSFPARMFSSPSRSRNAEEKKAVAGLRSATAVKSSEEIDARKSSDSVLKARNPSPIRRLSFAMGKMIKNAGSRENSPLRSRSSSKEYVAKSGSEAVVTAVSLDSSCNDKLSNNNNRGRSSPLRRLLDPLLKPRASNSSEPSKKHSSTVDTINSCNEPLDFCLGHSVKVNSRPSNGTLAGISDSHHHQQNGLPLLQALLQVSFKNGLPLFTFAIDNESNILAATVRKSSIPGKGHHSWTYTFFTIREVKKKSGIWLNQGGKSDGNGYVPNVVAQMRVSDSFNRHNNADCNITREFGLFAVDVGHGDQYATDFHPTNDLAAIIVKLPRNAAGNESIDDQSSYNWLDSSQDSRANLQEMRSADSGGHLPYQHSLTSLNLSTTVILPGGVHTVPSKGEISTLAERWRSGGSCDCGGWDLGCQLRVYTNQKEFQRKTSSSGISLNKDKLQIFSQGNQDNQPVLSLAPFKDRIYSVEFSSSLSLLQTFAICISFIDCRRPPEFIEPSNVIDKTTNEAGVFDVTMRTKTANLNLGEAPARYVSYPPHSPVGRV
ncbi:hypothetical protein RDABS01_023919 [Bienertia sinuspersici]